MNRAMDWTNWVSSLHVFLIFFGPMLSAGSMMQDQTQWSTLGSKSLGKVPLSCPTSCCASAKAGSDTEIFRISLSIFLMKCCVLFCFPISELTQQLLLFLAMKCSGST